VKLLAFEASTRRLSVALWNDGALAEKSADVPNGGSERLLPWANALLAESGLVFAQLDGLALQADDGDLLLAAANLGLGAVWCGIKGHQEEAVRKILGAPSKLGVLCIIPLGYPAEAPPPSTKYKKTKVHWNRY